MERRFDCQIFCCHQIVSLTHSDAARKTNDDKRKEDYCLALATKEYHRYQSHGQIEYCRTHVSECLFSHNSASFFIHCDAIKRQIRKKNPCKQRLRAALSRHFDTGPTTPSDKALDFKLMIHRNNTHVANGSCRPIEENMKRENRPN